jgi:hypothetical protein
MTTEHHHSVDVPVFNSQRTLVETVQTPHLVEVTPNHKYLDDAWSRLDKVVVGLSIGQIVSMVVLVVANFVAFILAIVFTSKASSGRAKAYFSLCIICAITSMLVGILGIVASALFPTRIKTKLVLPRKILSIVHLILFTILVIIQVILTFCILAGMDAADGRLLFEALFLFAVLVVAMIILICNGAMVVLSSIRLAFIIKQDISFKSHNSSIHSTSDTSDNSNSNSPRDLE